MLIRLIPPSPHPTVLYGLSFPSVLPLYDLGPGATLPAAWSSQIQILTSVLHLEPPSSIHMLDRAVGMVARVRQVSMHVPRKEIEVIFVDGRVVIIPMNSDCVRMLSSVVVDVKGCSEPETQRSSLEGSTAGSTESHASGNSPPKPSKLGRHKRQRSLLFSLISSLVPKSLSLSLPSRPPTSPPRTSLPPLPVACTVTSPVTPQRTRSVLTQPNPEIFRRRARATLVDVWRRHVIPALTPQHAPAAGYAEWTLIAMAGQVQAEIESVEVVKSHQCSVTKAGGSRHRKVQSESRHAFDFGDRRASYESEQRRCRAPSPFLDMLNAEDTERVVYPRQERGEEVLHRSPHSINVTADEWRIRYVHHPRSSDETDVFSVGYNGHNDSLLAEHFPVGEDWDENERLIPGLSRMGSHGTSGVYNLSPNFEDKHLHPADFVLNCGGDEHGLVDTAFDVSRCPLIPCDINDDEESDDSQTSVRTPEDGEDLPLVPLARGRQGSIRHVASSAPEPPLVPRASSFRPRSRIASAQYSDTPSTPAQALHPSASYAFTSSSAHEFDCRDTQVDELITSHFAYLERIHTALEVVRSRAREEGWSLVRATSIGGKSGWTEVETEVSLETRAKRRAWSSGVKISAPYSTSRSPSKVWDGTLSTLMSPMRPPGLASRSTGTPQVRGPIVPTGLSLGIPVRSSPLAMQAWGAEGWSQSSPSKYGALNSVHSTETIKGKRPLRVTFADSITNLFPVCEDDNEDLFESPPANAIGFPHAVPPVLSAKDLGYGLPMGPVGNEDDPFCFCPPWPRQRTTSMYAPSLTLSPPSPPILPMFRCSTPLPHDQVAGDAEASSAANNEQGGLDASALLLQPFSLSSISPPSQPSLSQTSLTTDLPFAPRPRAVSLPALRSYSTMNTTCHASFDQEDEHCEDLSRVYASPPPDGPLVISTTLAPHDQYPRYAHVHSLIPPSKRGMSASILGSKEVVFEQAGSEFTVGIEVALGRAEEGRVVWGPS